MIVSPYQVQWTLCHTEVSVSYHPSNPKSNLKGEISSSHRKFNREFMTRNAFEKHFIPSKVDAALYKKHIPVPPIAPLNPLKLDKITVQGPTIFVAGRYRKLTRTLSQTPWVLHGKRMMEESVSEIIIEHFAEFFGIPADKVIFSSSGREDVDVSVGSSDWILTFFDSNLNRQRSFRWDVWEKGDHSCWKYKIHTKRHYRKTSLGTSKHWWKNRTKCRFGIFNLLRGKILIACWHL